MDSHEILDALARDDGLPLAALKAAAERRTEMVPLFLGEIERWLAAPAGEDVEPMRLFFAFHLLGDWKEKSAYRPLARLMARREDEIEAILGDGLLETGHRVMAAVCDDDPRPLFDIVRDPDADEFVRAAMCEALAIAVLHGSLDRCAVARFLADCFTDLRPQSECFVWHGWQSAIATLGLADLAPLVKEAFAQGYITPSWLGFEHFVEDLERSTTVPGAPRRRNSRMLLPFGDTIEELSTWYCFSDAYRREQERYRRKDEEAGSVRVRGRTNTNPLRGVGRNDPCPCGSGRKFKKCCLE